VKGPTTHRSLGTDDEIYEEIKDKTFLIAPEMAMTRIQLFKYDEVLSDKTPVVGRVNAGEALASLPDEERYYAGYEIKRYENKPVVAQSTLPLFNPGIEFVPSKDFVPRVKFQGRQGYIWKKLPVGTLLDGTVCWSPGVFEILSQTFPEYLEQITGKDPRGTDSHLFYIGGKCVADILTVHAVINRIRAQQELKRKAGLEGA